MYVYCKHGKICWAKLSRTHPNEVFTENFHGVLCLKYLLYEAHIHVYNFYGKTFMVAILLKTTKV